jgi:hypothetical protein
MYWELLAQNRKLAENVGSSWWTLIENTAQYIHFFTVSNFEHGINGNQSKRFPSIKEMRKTMKGADYCPSVLQTNWCLKKFQGWETTLQCNDVDRKFRRDRKNCTSDAFSCSPQSEDAGPQVERSCIPWNKREIILTGYWQVANINLQILFALYSTPIFTKWAEMQPTWPLNYKCHSTLQQACIRQHESHRLVPASRRWNLVGANPLCPKGQMCCPPQ